MGDKIYNIAPVLSCIPDVYINENFNNCIYINFPDCTPSMEYADGKGLFPGRKQKLVRVVKTDTHIQYSEAMQVADVVHSELWHMPDVHHNVPHL